MYRVRIASKEEFLESRDMWNKLVSTMKRPIVFCSWEWIYTWWKHFGKLYEPLIFFVYNERKVVGIFPLVARNMRIEDTWVSGLILSFCGSMELYPDHLDIISSEKNASPSLNAILEFLYKNNNDWDVLHLSHIAEDSCLIPWLKKQDRAFDIQKISVASYIPLRDGFNEYMKTFSSKHRYNIRRSRNRLYQKYDVQFSICDINNKNKIEANLKELFELHQSRRQQIKSKSSFTGKSIENFHYDLAQQFGKTGCLRLASLRKGDKVIAVDYGFAFEGRYSYYQCGFDPDWSNQSVGSVMSLNLIENSCKEDLKEFDFLRGGESYKVMWTKKARSLFNINIYNKTFRGALIKSTHRTRIFLKNLLKKTSGNRCTSKKSMTK